MGICPIQGYAMGESRPCPGSPTGHGAATEAVWQEWAELGAWVTLACWPGSSALHLQSPEETALTLQLLPPRQSSLSVNSADSYCPQQPPETQEKRQAGTHLYHSLGQAWLQ
jgi:hypothetical protein